MLTWNPTSTGRTQSTGCRRVKTRRQHTRRPEWRSLFNPVNNLVYNADGRSVHTVIVDGKVVVEDHTPVFVDEWELIQKTQKLGEGLLARTGVSFPSRWPVV